MITDTTHYSSNIKYNWHQFFDSLIHYGWVQIPHFLNNEFITNLLLQLKLHLEKDQFEDAAIGGKFQHSLAKEIRLSQTTWIDHWDTSSELTELSEFFHQFMQAMNSYFYLSIKRWESQFAIYPIGGFYKKHKDQLKGSEHRQVTFITYLNDCENGGELVIYDRDDRSKIAATISPRAGSCVIFFSSQIFHEVRPTLSPRFSLTTWFRDDI